MQQTPLGIFSVGHAEDNGIALIALYGFQVLDEEWFILIAFEEELLLWRTLTTLGQKLVDQILLCYAKRNNTEAPLRMVLNILVD